MSNGNVSNEESEFATAAERHHQIMIDLDKGMNRIVWGCAGLVVIIIGALIFYFLKYDPFWKYP